MPSSCLDKKTKERISSLLKEQNANLSATPSTIKFTGEEIPDVSLRNIKEYPHLFVLGCIMDRQTKAERAWKIPYLVSTELCSSLEFEEFLKLQSDQLQRAFGVNRTEDRWHRFPGKMAECFYEGIQKIQEKYHGDASKIWVGTPQSATVVRRFLQFHGVGIKIATMATNILSRDFKIPMADKTSIDVSPDIHVKRVIRRLGFISQNASSEELVYFARELNPEYPGIIDLPLWNIGSKWCKEKTPRCGECYLGKDCPKIMSNDDASGDA